MSLTNGTKTGTSTPRSGLPPSSTGQTGTTTPSTGERAPVVVGINFGNTYASIAVLNKNGNAECIANEDGERQIACAISFHGEEVLIGHQAKPQLVKNAENTITGFRNLLGKKFSEIPKDKPPTSAPIIQHPDLPDTPAYKVSILQPAPTPLPTHTLSTPLSRSTAATPLASHLATPKSEPTPADRIITIPEANTLFLKSLIQSAQDFLGTTVDGAVISVPSSFDDNARAALEGAARDAGIEVLQLLDEVAAASVISTLNTELPHDRTVLVVDLGQSSLHLSLLSLRHGLAYVLASSDDASISGDLIDDRLVKYFAKEFTKKTKLPLTVCPAVDKADKRAEAKLRIAIEHTKRTLSASPSAAACSVESLKDGVDFNGSINRLRFDMEMRAVYDGVYAAVVKLLQTVGMEELHVDEIVYVGGSASLPGLDETFFAKKFPEEVVTPFTAGTVIGGGPGDPTTIVARGCALQAKIVSSIPDDDVVKGAFKKGSELAVAPVTTKTLGIVFPEADAAEESMGGQWTIGVPRATPLPYRRIIQLDADIGDKEVKEKKTGFDLWEVKESVFVETTAAKEKPAKSTEGGDADADDEDLEDSDVDEPTEEREIRFEKETHLGSICLIAKNATLHGGRWKTRLEIHFIVEVDGKVAVTAWETHGGIKGEPVEITVPAST